MDVLAWFRDPAANGGKDAGFGELRVSFKHFYCPLLGRPFSVSLHVWMQKQMSPRRKSLPLRTNRELIFELRDQPDGDISSDPQVRSGPRLDHRPRALRLVPTLTLFYLFEFTNKVDE